MSLTWEITSLNNGLRVVTTPVPTAQSVSVNLFVGVGSRAEERRISGLAHFLEHMLFKGTRTRPSAIAIAEAVEGAGGTINAYTGKEITCYWDHLPYDRLPLAVEILADMIENPLLEPEEIDRERSVVQQEIRRTQDQPAAWAGELLSQAVYGDHPMGWSITGTIESLEGIVREDFLAYMRTWYSPGNIVLSVAGNVEPPQVVAVAERFLGALQSFPTTSFPPINGDRPARQVIVEDRPTAQAHIALAALALARKDPDRYALMILNSVLGRGMSSRLFKEVRERRGLAYTVGSSVSRHSDTGTLNISAGVSAGKIVETVQVIAGELRRMVEEPVSDDELTKARDYTIGNFRLGLETTMSLGQRTGESLLTMGEIEPIESVVANLAAVTAEDIQRVAARIFQTERLALAAVGPGMNEDELAAALAA